MKKIKTKQTHEHLDFISVIESYFKHLHIKAMYNGSLSPRKVTTPWACQKLSISGMK